MPANANQLDGFIYISTNQLYQSRAWHSHAIGLLLANATSRYLPDSITFFMEIKEDNAHYWHKI